MKLSSLWQGQSQAQSSSDSTRPHEIAGYEVIRTLEKGGIVMVRLVKKKDGGDETLAADTKGFCNESH